MKKVWEFLYKREWAAAIGVLAVIADAVQQTIKESGPQPPQAWTTILLVVVAGVVRSNVWSRKSAEVLRDSMPPVLTEPVEIVPEVVPEP